MSTQVSVKSDPNTEVAVLVGLLPVTLPGKNLITILTDRGL